MNDARDPDGGAATPRPPAARGSRVRVGSALAFLAAILVAINFRPGASSVGPVLEEMRASLDMGAAAAGLLTAFPGFCFGIFGLLAVRLAGRVGTIGGIVVGLVAIATGLLLRPLTGATIPFLLLSALGLGGMAVGNVLVPSWIKRHESGGNVLLMTVYSTGLVVGGAAGSLTAAPVTDAFSGDWRPALAIWGATALVALVPWLVILRREHEDPAEHHVAVASPRVSMWRSPIAVAMMVLFAIQSMNAYVQMGWLPQIYRDAGLSPVAAGALLSLLTGVTAVGGVGLPSIIARTRRLSVWMIGFAVTAVAGYIGLWLVPLTLPWLWAVLLGLGGCAFPAVMALITQRTRTPRVTAQLSGFVQPYGYMLAGVGPLAVGLIHDVVGGWTLVLILLALTSVAMGWIGVRAARPGFVDDEL